MLRTIPIFPLPNVVLFPDVPLTLHVFEPRYRAMVQDALDTNRTIGITVLEPGYQADYHGRPPIYPYGCAGAIVREEKLPDGRFNIVLRGRERFRVIEEQPGGVYRNAVVQTIEDEPSEDPGRLDRLGQELLDAVSRRGDTALVLQGEWSAGLLVNALCQGLDLPVLEKLALLECASTEARALRLLDLLEYHRLEGGRPRGRPN